MPRAAGWLPTALPCSRPPSALARTRSFAPPRFWPRRVSGSTTRLSSPAGSKRKTWYGEAVRKTYTSSNSCVILSQEVDDEVHRRPAAAVRSQHRSGAAVLAPGGKRHGDGGEIARGAAEIRARLRRARQRQAGALAGWCLPAHGGAEAAIHPVHQPACEGCCRPG